MASFGMGRLSLWHLFSWEVFVGPAEGEVAVLQVYGVVGVEGGEFPEAGRKGADVWNGFVGWAWAGVAAGAVAFCGDEFGCGMAIGPWGVILVVGDVFADAVDGVSVDDLGQGGRGGRRVLSV